MHGPPKMYKFRVHKETKVLMTDFEADALRAGNTIRDILTAAP